MEARRLITGVDVRMWVVLTPGERVGYKSWREKTAADLMPAAGVPS
jgi:hypothetical protein